MFNPGVSIKDRQELLMLTKALETGRLEKGGTVIESSSGNMAIGLVQACRYLGLRLMLVVDPKINGHTLKVIKAYGVQVEQTQSHLFDFSTNLVAKPHSSDEFVPDKNW